MLRSRYFLTWRETAEVFGLDIEGLRQVMLVRLQVEGDVWLPVHIDSRNQEFLARLAWSDLAREVEVWPRTAAHDGLEVDIAFSDGSTIPNNGATATCSWHATHDHGAGWKACYAIGGKLALSPRTVIDACVHHGYLGSSIIELAPRDWCNGGLRYAVDGLDFALVHSDADFADHPKHLFHEAVFFAEDVERVKETISGVVASEKAEGQLSTKERNSMLGVVGAMLALLRSEDGGKFPSQASVIDALLTMGPERQGLSQRNLEKIFAEAKRIANSQDTERQ